MDSLSVEIHRADKNFEIGDVKVQAGDYVARADQPFRILADMYFGLQQFSLDNPRPYDDTGWTFQLMRNVDIQEVKDPEVLEQRMTPVTYPAVAPGGLNGRGNVVVVDHTTDNNLMAFRFKHAGVRMLAAEEDFEMSGHEFRAGAFIIPDLAGLPGSASLLSRLSWIHRRQGRWPESLGEHERLREMDPRSTSTLLNHGVTLMALGRYAEADAAFRRGAEFNPEVGTLWGLMAWNMVLWQGDVEAAEAVLAQGLLDAVREPLLYYAALEIPRLRRDPRRLLALAAEGNSDEVGASGQWAPRALFEAEAYGALGDSARARAAFASAREVAERALAARPDDHRVPTALGLVLAGVGLRDEAVAASRKGVEQLSVEDDALWGPGQLWGLALIHAQLGEADAAVDLIGQVLAIPNFATSRAWLRLEPRLDPIRAHPRFQALVAGGER